MPYFENSRRMYQAYAESSSNKENQTLFVKRKTFNDKTFFSLVKPIPGFDDQIFCQNGGRIFLTPEARKNIKKNI